MSLIKGWEEAGRPGRQERPILFSGPMVEAILAGRKTQTRRVIIPQPNTHGFWPRGTPPGAHERDCDYGAVGTHLWVRETHYRFGHWDPVETTRTRTGRQKWRFVAHDDAGVLFEPPPAGFRKGRHHKDPGTPAWHKRLARFMPRSLSRIILEVTEVRIQCLQDITEEDARAEGIALEGLVLPGHARGVFSRLWDSINGERPGCSWEENPWVWAVSFRVLEKGG